MEEDKQLIIEKWHDEWSDWRELKLNNKTIGDEYEIDSQIKALTDMLNYLKIDFICFERKGKYDELTNTWSLNE